MVYSLPVAGNTNVFVWRRHPYLVQHLMSEIFNAINGKSSRLLSGAETGESVRCVTKYNNTSERIPCNVVT